MKPSKVLTACSLALFALVGAAHGQDRQTAQLLRPPANVPEHMFEQAQGLDAGGAQLRIDRLENQVRSLTGQLEETQFQMKRLEDQLRKFQQDVDFRFDELKPGKPGPKAPAAPAAPAGQPKRTDLNENGYPVIVQTAPAAAEPAPLAQASAPARGPARRGDAFDPAQDPNAPGAPRDLSTMAPGANAAPAPAARKAALPSGPIESADEVDPNAPLELTPRPATTPLRSAGTDPTATATLPPQASAPRVIAAPEGAPGAPSPAAGSQPMAALAPVPANDYDLASAALRDGQYEVAEQRFRSYLEKNPKDRLTPEATFFLGESYFRRARAREAAEQYLRVTVDFPRATRAPEALVKLGLSLEKLGAKEQACAAFGEVGRKYPAASSAVRVSAERESKRVQC
jgi:tol-pal system protein YbgF